MSDDLGWSDSKDDDFDDDGLDDSGDDEDGFRWVIPGLIPADDGMADEWPED